MKRECV